MLKFQKEIKIGAIVAMGLSALIWGVPFLKGSDIFSNNQRLIAIYTNVDGIAPSNPVQLSGLKIGQVEKLSFLEDNSGRIRVTFLVDKSVKIPKGTIARIINADLLGSKAVNLELSTNTIMVNDGDTLMAGNQIGLMDEVRPIKDKAQGVLSSVDTVLSEFAKEDGGKKLSKIVSNIENATRNLDGLIAKQQSRLDNILANVESISSNLKKNNDHISKALANINSITDSVSKSNLKHTINNADKAITETAAILKQINEGKGTIGMLVHNDSLYKSLNATARDLDKLLIDLRANPKKYISVSVFGGKEKKTKNK